MATLLSTCIPTANDPRREHQPVITLQKRDGTRDKACFGAHTATPHVKHAEDRLKREKLLIEPAKEWHCCRLIDSPHGRSYKKL
jgi:hypothetical protein